MRPTPSWRARGRGWCETCDTCQSVGSVPSVGEGTLAWDIAKDAAQPIVCQVRRYDDAELSSEACRTEAVRRSR
eukprot:scaffold21127_cov57-Phaeocystis_antarctica.AAC.2